MTYNKEQLIIFDKILKYYYDFEILKIERRNPTNDLFTKLFNIDKELAQFCINEVLKIGSELNLLNSEKFGYGNYGLVKLHKIPTEIFINQGGFSKYFEEIYEENKSEKDFKKFERGLNKKFIIYGFIVLILSFLISVFSTFWQKQNNIDSTDSLKIELQKIQKRIDKLEEKKSRPKKE